MFRPFRACFIFLSVSQGVALGYPVALLRSEDKQMVRVFSPGRCPELSCCAPAERRRDEAISFNLNL